MKYLFLIFSICSFNLLFGQTLERKVQFGARIEYVTENGQSGCKVQQVARGTSVALELQENDLIQKIGASTFGSTDEFINKFLAYTYCRSRWWSITSKDAIPEFPEPSAAHFVSIHRSTSCDVPALK
jgi:hypothetical protein